MNVRKILTILTIFILFNPVYALADNLLFGSAEYNVNSAREQVADGIAYKINKNIFQSKIYDYDNKSNLENIIKGNLELKDRTLAFFSDSTYGILYKDEPYSVYYYDANGFLIYIDQKSSLNYPYNFYKYDTTGNLINMGVRVSKEETYIYSPDEKLIAHWVGNNAYDEKNNIIMKRRYQK